METHTIIPAGYRLSVVSWENDADNYRTHTMSGLTEAQVRFLIAWSKKLHSSNDDDAEANGYIGNQFEHSVLYDLLLADMTLKISQEHPGGLLDGLAELLEEYRAERCQMILGLDEVGHGSIYDWRQERQLRERYETLEMPKSLADVSSFIQDKIYSELFGYSEWHIRVYESHTVEYVPEEIRIKDVTEEFE